MVWCAYACEGRASDLQTGVQMELQLEAVAGRPATDDRTQALGGWVRISRQPRQGEEKDLPSREWAGWDHKTRALGHQDYIGPDSVSALIRTAHLAEDGPVKATSRPGTADARAEAELIAELRRQLVQTREQLVETKRELHHYKLEANGKGAGQERPVEVHAPETLRCWSCGALCRGPQVEGEGVHNAESKQVDAQVACGDRAELSHDFGGTGRRRGEAANTQDLQGPNPALLGNLPTGREGVGGGREVGATRRAGASVDQGKGSEEDKTMTFGELETPHKNFTWGGVEEVALSPLEEEGLEGGGSEGEVEGGGRNKGLRTQQTTSQPRASRKAKASEALSSLAQNSAKEGVSAGERRRRSSGAGNGGGGRQVASVAGSLGRTASTKAATAAAAGRRQGALKDAKPPAKEEGERGRGISHSLPVPASKASQLRRSAEPRARQAQLAEAEPEEAKDGAAGGEGSGLGRGEGVSEDVLVWERLERAMESLNSEKSTALYATLRRLRVGMEGVDPLRVWDSFLQPAENRFAADGGPVASAADLISFGQVWKGLMEQRLSCYRAELHEIKGYLHAPQVSMPNESSWFGFVVREPRGTPKRPTAKLGARAHTLRTHARLSFSSVCLKWSSSSWVLLLCCFIVARIGSIFGVLST